MKLAFVLLITSIAFGQTASKPSEAKVQEADLKRWLFRRELRSRWR